jgi:hypothetical protein
VQVKRKARGITSYSVLIYLNSSVSGLETMGGRNVSAYPISVRVSSEARNYVSLEPFVRLQDQLPLFQ